MAVQVSPGQRHESRVFATVLDEVRVVQPKARPRRRPGRVAGDKAYSVPWIRRWLRRRGIAVTIPHKKDQRRRGPFDPRRCKQRNVVERCIGWLKQCRAVATRYDKLARNYLATLRLAMIRRYLRAGFSETA